jgi:hypothetical protein
MVEADTCRKGDKMYWDGLYAWLEGKGYSKVLKHLLNVDVSGFDAVEDRPKGRLYLNNSKRYLGRLSRCFLEVPGHELVDFGGRMPGGDGL